MWLVGILVACGDSCGWNPFVGWNGFFGLIGIFVVDGYGTVHTPDEISCGRWRLICLIGISFLKVVRVPSGMSVAG